MLIKVGVKFFKAINDVIDEVGIIFLIAVYILSDSTLHEVIMMFKLF